MIISRDAYLRVLVSHLRVDARTRLELLTDLENHILDGIAAGEPEEHVIARLGDPAQIANAFNRPGGRRRTQATAALAGAAAIAAAASAFFDPHLNTSPPATSLHASGATVVALDPRDRSVVYIGAPKIRTARRS